MAHNSTHDSAPFSDSVDAGRRSALGHTHSADDRGSDNVDTLNLRERCKRCGAACTGVVRHRLSSATMLHIHSHKDSVCFGGRGVLRLTRDGTTRHSDTVQRLCVAFARTLHPQSLRTCC